MWVVSVDSAFTDREEKHATGCNERDRYLKASIFIQKGVIYVREVQMAVSVRPGGAPGLASPVRSPWLRLPCAS
jgi:hypothetical protein